MVKFLIVGGLRSFPSSLYGLRVYRNWNSVPRDTRCNNVCSSNFKREISVYCETLICRPSGLLYGVIIQCVCSAKKWSLQLVSLHWIINICSAFSFPLKVALDTLWKTWKNRGISFWRKRQWESCACSSMFGGGQLTWLWCAFSIFFSLSSGTKPEGRDKKCINLMDDFSKFPANLGILGGVLRGFRGFPRDFWGVWSLMKIYGGANRWDVEKSFCWTAPGNIRSLEILYKTEKSEETWYVLLLSGLCEFLGGAKRQRVAGKRKERKMKKSGEEGKEQISQIRKFRQLWFY